MSIEYLGLSSINGPLIALEGVQGAFFDEIVEFVIGGSERKIGRIIELYEDKAVIQVFEGSENMSLKNTHTLLPDPITSSEAIPGFPGWLHIKWEAALYRIADSGHISHHCCKNTP